jgi:hypothetical protein
MTQYEYEAKAEASFHHEDTKNALYVAARRFCHSHETLPPFAGSEAREALTLNLVALHVAAKNEATAAKAAGAPHWVDAGEPRA